MMRKMLLAHWGGKVEGGRTPAQSIEATVDLSFRSPSPGLQTAEFLLHRQLAVTDVSGTANRTRGS